MSKKNKGLFPFVMGIAMGAAAVFLSKDENRQKTKKAVDKTVKEVKLLKEDVEKDPEKVKEVNPNKDLCTNKKKV